MQIETLREFMALSIAKNFSEAARMLNTSQPSLSRHMDMLEKELRLKLILRTKPVSLTPEGIRVRAYVTDMLRAYDGMAEYAKAARRETHTVIAVHDISFSPLPYDFLSRCENRFVADNESVSFKYVAPKSGKSYWEMFEQGSLDIGWVYGFGTVDESVMVNVPEELEAVSIPAFRGELCLAVSKGNPLLASSASRPTIADCHNLKFMAQAERHLDHFRNSFAKFCQRFGGFNPAYDFHEADNPKGFYSSEPGNSAFICANYGDNDNPLLTPWVVERTDLIKFDEYFCNTFAVFPKAKAGTVVETFVRDYLSKPFVLGRR
ncbi:MAG: LysR family transcriptional regulator [Coriobacteriales bacterium]|jgi:DNA-binding transcriptional LysR family regulator|nr:LysR family transcriptional regulator [Coriobacteriales bacterium]